MSGGDVFLGIIAILFPPVAVWIKSGLCSADSFINLALCCLGYLPGLFHAWYIILRHPERNYDYEPIDNERGGQGQQRVTYYYISHDPNGQGRQYGAIGPAQHQPQSSRQSKPKSKPAAVAPQPQETGVAVAGESRPGPSSQENQAAPPPSYAEVVKGDHKIQTQD